MAGLIDYLNRTTWDRYEVQLLRKDLIGMALQAQTDGKTLAEVVGSDVKHFAESLRDDIGRGSIWDMLVTQEFWISTVSAVLNLAALPFYVFSLFRGYASSTGGIYWEYELLRPLLLVAIFALLYYGLGIVMQKLPYRHTGALQWLLLAACYLMLTAGLDGVVTYAVGI